MCKMSSTYLVQNERILVSVRCLITEFSICCKNISAMVPEMGEPMATPLSGWYIWPWKEK